MLSLSLPLPLPLPLAALTFLALPVREGCVVHRVTCVATKRIPRAVCLGNRQRAFYLRSQRCLQRRDGNQVESDPLQLPIINTST